MKDFSKKYKLKGWSSLGKPHRWQRKFERAMRRLGVV